MPNVQLIPFGVEGITENTVEVPRGIRMIRARSIWREGDEGENVVVAVIDTGCQPGHSISLIKLLEDIISQAIIMVILAILPIITDMGLTAELWQQQKMGL
ncbi:hypothetical protein ACIQD3_18585 [Peribacillus loiseleuriae]|uniref:hypothetical protein n=1 Tax=Peribacillus loiseleuriae TaxID=1679170 RepID=UPI0037FD9AE1